jgi:hypothetical protein
MKIIIFTFVALIASSCKLEMMMEAPSMALAKDICSCLFVANQTDSYCKNLTRYQRMLAKFKVNREEKTVLAKGLGNYSKAIYQSDRLGCTISNSSTHRRDLRD